jgi:capsular exopolysaccharide synthesis family protein
MEATEPIGGHLSFADYLRPIWRFKFIILIMIVVAAAATYEVTKRQTKSYQTATELYVGATDLAQITQPGSGTTPAHLQDDAILVTTPAVANIVKKNLHLKGPAGQYIGDITAAPDSNGGDFLDITAVSTIPKLAAELANGFAKAFLEQNRDQVVSAAKGEVNAAKKRLPQVKGVANLSVREGIKQQIINLDAIVADPPPLGSQVFVAGVPGVPVSPKPTEDAFFAGALMLVLGIILSYVFDRRDRGIRTLAELESLFEVPVLTAVPHTRHPEPSRSEPYGVPAALREPYRTLRVNLEIARGMREAKVIMVTSALGSEGKSTVVRNLAITYREAGMRVAVIEGDLRRPVLAKQFGVEEGPGLSEALSKDGPPRLQRVPHGVLDELLPRSELNGGGGRLDVLVAGSIPQDPTVLLTDDRMHLLMTSLAAGYDLVLVDSPPVLLVSDALALMSLVDGVIIVARAGTITEPAAVRLRATLDRVTRIKRAHVIGAVANDVVDEHASSYYKPYAKTTRQPTTEGSAIATPEPAARPEPAAQ